MWLAVKRVVFVAEFVCCIILGSHQFDLKGRVHLPDLCVGGIVSLKGVLKM